MQNSTTGKLETLVDIMRVVSRQILEASRDSGLSDENLERINAIHIDAVNLGVKIDEARAWVSAQEQR